MVSTASQAAASAAGPVRYTDAGPGRGAGARSRTVPGRSRRAGRSGRRARSGAAGCPSRPGIICPAISRRHASSIASWRRCAAVRVSSGPAFCPSASSTTVSAAAQAGVRSPCSRPAPPKVVSSHSARSSNPSLAGIGGGLGAFEHFPAPAAPDHADPRRPAPRRAGSRPRRPELFGELVGPVADQPGQRHRDLPRRERGRDRRGGRRAAAPTRCAAAAAPLVTRVIARSQDGGAVLPVGLIPVLGGERGKDPRPGGGVLRFGALPARSAPRPARRCPGWPGVTAGQVAEPGADHRQRLPRTGGRGGLGRGAHRGRSPPQGQERFVNRFLVRY